MCRIIDAAEHKYQAKDDEIGCYALVIAGLW
jgi:hypothetical protein